MKYRVTVIMMVAVLFGVGVVEAQLVSGSSTGDNNSRSGGFRKGKMPQEMISACSGKSEGSSCSVTTPRGDTMSGTCASMDGQLGCKPSDMGQGGPRGGQPPQEAISACSSKSEGSSCSMTSPRGDTMSGTCEDHDGQLACRPQMSNRR